MSETMSSGLEPEKQVNLVYLKTPVSDTLAHWPSKDELTKPVVKHNMFDWNPTTIATVDNIVTGIPPMVTSVVADGAGKRDSSGKPRYDLIPPEFLKALAVHYAEGARKYDERNWERGMKWGECIRALESHLTEWRMGNDLDIDPKMPGYAAHHLIAVAWNAIALYIYQTRAIGTDDRCIQRKE